MTEKVRFFLPLPRIVKQYIARHPYIQKVVSNTGWLFFDKIWSMFLGMFVGVWVARYLGPSRYGIFNYAMAFVALFSGLAGLGLDQIVVREIVKKPEKCNSTLGTAFTLRITASILTILIVLHIIHLIRPDDVLTRLAVKIMSLSLFFQAFNVIDFWFIARVQSKVAVWARSLAVLFVSCLKIISILNEASLIPFLWLNILQGLFISIGLAIVYRVKHQSILAWNFSWMMAKKLLLDGWPMIFASFATMLQMKIDQVMIGQMLGSSAVGIYAAAAKLSQLWYFVPVAIVQSVYPSIVKSRELSQKEYLEKIQKLCDCVLLLALVLSICMTLFGNNIVNFLYGPDYQGAGSVLALHIWSGIFVFLGSASGTWILAENLQIISLYKQAFCALVNITLNLFLIPAYGIAGAALATLLAQGSMIIFYTLFPGISELKKVLLRSVSFYWVFDLLRKKYATRTK